MPLRCKIDITKNYSANDRRKGNAPSRFLIRAMGFGADDRPVKVESAYFPPGSPIDIIDKANPADSASFKAKVKKANELLLARFEAELTECAKGSFGLTLGDIKVHDPDHDRKGRDEAPAERDYFERIKAWVNKLKAPDYLLSFAQQHHESKFAINQGKVSDADFAEICKSKTTQHRRKESDSSFQWSYCGTAPQIASLDGYPLRGKEVISQGYSSFCYPNFKKEIEINGYNTATLDMLGQRTYDQIYNTIIGLNDLRRKEGKTQGLYSLNPPGAFVRGLDDSQKNHVRAIIKNAYRQAIKKACAKDPQIARRIEFTAHDDSINPDKVHLSTGESLEVHESRGDFYKIGQECSRKRVAFQIPLMGEPDGAIGNLGSDDAGNSAMDEDAARKFGLSHCIKGAQEMRRYLKHSLSSKSTTLSSIPDYVRSDDAETKKLISQRIAKTIAEKTKAAFDLRFNTNNPSGNGSQQYWLQDYKELGRTAHGSWDLGAFPCFNHKYRAQYLHVPKQNRSDIATILQGNPDFKEHNRAFLQQYFATIHHFTTTEKLDPTKFNTDRLLRAFESMDLMGYDINSDIAVNAAITKYPDLAKSIFSDKNYRHRKKYLPETVQKTIDVILKAHDRSGERASGGDSPTVSGGGAGGGSRAYSKPSRGRRVSAGGGAKPTSVLKTFHRRSVEANAMLRLIFKAMNDGSIPSNSVFAKLPSDSINGYIAEQLKLKTDPSAIEKQVRQSLINNLNHYYKTPGVLDSYVAKISALAGTTTAKKADPTEVARVTGKVRKGIEKWTEALNLPGAPMLTYVKSFATSLGDAKITAVGSNITRGHVDSLAHLKAKVGTTDEDLTDVMYRMQLSSTTCQIADSDGSPLMDSPGKIGKEFKITSFCYPPFNSLSYQKLLKSDDGIASLQSEVKAQFLLSIAQGGDVLDIIPPGAFVRGLDPTEKNKVATLIIEALKDALDQTEVSHKPAILFSGRKEVNDKTHDFGWGGHLDAIKEACSKGGRLDDTHYKDLCPDKDGFTKYDFGSIAIYCKNQGLNFFLPMMGEPLGAVGNGASGYKAESAADECLARQCGGLHTHTLNAAKNRNLTRLPARIAISKELEPATLSNEKMKTGSAKGGKRRFATTSGGGGAAKKPAISAKTSKGRQKLYETADSFKKPTNAAMALQLFLLRSLANGPGAGQHCDIAKGVINEESALYLLKEGNHEGARTALLQKFQTEGSSLKRRSSAFLDEIKHTGRKFNTATDLTEYRTGIAVWIDALKVPNALQTYSEIFQKALQDAKYYSKDPNAATILDEKSQGQHLEELYKPELGNVESLEILLSGPAARIAGNDGLPIKNRERELGNMVDVNSFTYPNFKKLQPIAANSKKIFQLLQTQFRLSIESLLSQMKDGQPGLFLVPAPAGFVHGIPAYQRDQLSELILQALDAAITHHEECNPKTNDIDFKLVGTVATNIDEGMLTWWGGKWGKWHKDKTDDAYFNSIIGKRITDPPIIPKKFIPDSLSLATICKRNGIAFQAPMMCEVKAAIGHGASARFDTSMEESIVRCCPSTAVTMSSKHNKAHLIKAEVPTLGDGATAYPQYKRTAPATTSTGASSDLTTVAIVQNIIEQQRQWLQSTDGKRIFGTAENAQEVLDHVIGFDWWIFPGYTKNGDRQSYHIPTDPEATSQAIYRLLWEDKPARGTPSFQDNYLNCLSTYAQCLKNLKPEKESLVFDKRIRKVFESVARIGMDRIWQTEKGKQAIKDLYDGYKKLSPYKQISILSGDNKYSKYTTNLQLFYEKKLETDAARTTTGGPAKRRTATGRGPRIGTAPSLRRARGARPPPAATAADLKKYETTNQYRAQTLQAWSERDGKKLQDTLSQGGKPVTIPADFLQTSYDNYVRSVNERKDYEGYHKGKYAELCGSNSPLIALGLHKKETYNWPKESIEPCFKNITISRSKAAQYNPKQKNTNKLPNLSFDEALIFSGDRKNELESKGKVVVDVNFANADNFCGDILFHGRGVQEESMAEASPSAIALAFAQQGVNRENHFLDLSPEAYNVKTFNNHKKGGNAILYQNIPVIEEGKDGQYSAHETNQVAIAAHCSRTDGGVEDADLNKAKYHYQTALNGFKLCKSLGGKGHAVVARTGLWGSGAFGNPRYLMLAVQAIAAQEAGIDLDICCTKIFDASFEKRRQIPDSKHIERFKNEFWPVLRIVMSQGDLTIDEKIQGAYEIYQKGNFHDEYHTQYTKVKIGHKKEPISPKVVTAVESAKDQDRIAKEAETGGDIPELEAATHARRRMDAFAKADTRHGKTAKTVNSESEPETSGLAIAGTVAKAATNNKRAKALSATESEFIKDDKKKKLDSLLSKSLFKFTADRAEAQSQYKPLAENVGYKGAQLFTNLVQDKRQQGRIDTANIAAMLSAAAKYFDNDTSRANYSSAIKLAGIIGIRKEEITKKDGNNLDDEKLKKQLATKLDAIGDQESAQKQLQVAAKHYRQIARNETKPGNSITTPAIQQLVAKIKEVPTAIR